jgi:hypothetical protein
LFRSACAWRADLSESVGPIWLLMSEFLTLGQLSRAGRSIFDRVQQSGSKTGVSQASMSNVLRVPVDRICTIFLHDHGTRGCAQEKLAEEAGMFFKQVVKSGARRCNGAAPPGIHLFLSFAGQISSTRVGVVPLFVPDWWRGSREVFCGSQFRSRTPWGRPGFRLAVFARSACDEGRSTDEIVRRAGRQLRKMEMQFFLHFFLLFFLFVLPPVSPRLNPGVGHRGDRE